jgi:hypothetical protein
MKKKTIQKAPKAVPAPPTFYDDDFKKMLIAEYLDSNLSPIQNLRLETLVKCY